MKYAHVVSAFLGTLWSVLPEWLTTMRHVLRLRVHGELVPEQEIAAAEEIRVRREASLLARAQTIAPQAVRRSDGVVMAGRIALMPVFGVISQRLGAMERMSGGVSTEEMGATLDSLVADKQCRAICMVFDSPGGSVYGVQELGAKILSYRGEKKIVGVADSVAASAAYWLYAQCAECNVTPGGQVGSIGVIAAHEDLSKQAEEEGVKTTLVTSSKYKAEGNPFGPLDDEARAEIQSKVDAYHAAFVAAVAKGRDTTAHRVSQDFGQGRMKTAQEAVAAGMADRVATLEQVLSRMGAGSSGGAASAETESVTVAAKSALPKDPHQSRARLCEVESEQTPLG